MSVPHSPHDAATRNEYMKEYKREIQKPSQGE